MVQRKQAKQRAGFPGFFSRSAFALRAEYWTLQRHKVHSGTRRRHVEVMHRADVVYVVVSSVEIHIIIFILPSLDQASLS
uniref:Uncharacterized protein n=1 Tax=Anguilla anguilla TaxID=7936 RepID=A0A0E9WEP2_ANGAN